MTSSIDHNEIDHNDEYLRIGQAAAAVIIVSALFLALSAMLTAKTDPFEERNTLSRTTAITYREPTTDLVRHAETINVSESLAP